MNVIFLDIDGVLNSSQGAHYHHQQKTLGDRNEDYTRMQDELIAQGYEKDIAHDMLMTKEFDLMAVSNLRKLLLEFPEMKIVVSSTWRLGFKSGTLEVAEIFNLYQDIKERVIDRTLRIFNKEGQTVQRGEEIKEWLSRHPEVTQYVVFDDDGDMDAVRGNFIQTDSDCGLSFSNVQNAARLFRGAPNWRPNWFSRTCRSCTHYKKITDSKECVAGTCQMVFHLLQGIKNNQTSEHIDFTVGKDYSLEVMEDFSCPLREEVPWKGSNESSFC